MKGKSNSYCQRCKKWNIPLIKNSRSATKFFDVVQRYMCRECMNERGRKYYKNNKEKCKAIISKSIKKHQHKQDARVALNNAVRAGKVIKPERCSICDNRTDRIEGHHHDYNKPLAVTWQCTSCHSDSDRVAKA